MDNKENVREEERREVESIALAERGRTNPFTTGKEQTIKGAGAQRQNVQVVQDTQGSRGRRRDHNTTQVRMFEASGWKWEASPKILPGSRD